MRSSEVFVVGLAALLVVAEAGAIGGSGEDIGNQVDKLTQSCQATLGKATQRYTQRYAKSIQGCLDSILKCEKQKTDAKALACRRKLLVPSKGKCAEGKIDMGTSLVGSGSSAHVAANPKPKALLLKEYAKLVKQVDKKCSTADTTNGTNGLGFGGETDAGNLVDLTNASVGGLSCLANATVRASTPAADAIVGVVASLHDTCVASKDALLLGADCSGNGDADCGAKGKCGRLAQAFQDGPGGVGLAECGGNSCLVGTVECPAGCANLDVDPANCGSCGTVCGPTQTCSSGICTP